MFRCIAHRNPRGNQLHYFPLLAPQTEFHLEMKNRKDILMYWVLVNCSLHNIEFLVECWTKLRLVRGNICQYKIVVTDQVKKKHLMNTEPVRAPKRQNFPFDLVSDQDFILAKLRILI